MTPEKFGIFHRSIQGSIATTYRYYCQALAKLSADVLYIYVDRHDPLSETHGCWRMQGRIVRVVLGSLVVIRNLHCLYARLLCILQPHGGRHLKTGISRATDKEHHR